jgi:hypothetical protein
MGVKIGLDIVEGKESGGVWEYGVEENICS